MPLLAARRIDQAVTEVFTVMLGLPCTPITAEPPHPGPGALIAAVSFSGCVRGQCIVSLSRQTAQMLAAQMLGVDPGTLAAEEQPGLLADTVGELCNMIAGGWKSRLNATYTRCALTPPRILTTRENNMPDSPNIAPALLRFERSYGIFDECLLVEFLLAAIAEPGSLS